MLENVALITCRSMTGSICRIVDRMMESAWLELWWVVKNV